MFQILLNNILKRYTVTELSQRYSVNLPNNEKNRELLVKSRHAQRIHGQYYELLNQNRFSKRKGEKASALLIEGEKAIVIEGRVGLLARLIAWLMSLVSLFLQKITSFFTGLLPIVPENFKKVAEVILSILITIIAIPAMIIGVLANAFQIITRFPGGGAGIMLGLITASLYFIFQLILLLLGVLLSPLLDLAVDKLIDKPYIKKMVIGYFIMSNNYDGKVVLTNQTIRAIEYEQHKSLLGSQKLYVLIKEGEGKVSMIDKYFWSFLVPYYFINRQSVFVTDVEQQAHFEQLLQ